MAKRHSQTGSRSQDGERRKLTCDTLRVPCTFASSDEDHITLVGARVLVLQEKKLIDSIVLQCRDFDDDADRTSQAPFDNKILLSSDLRGLTGWLARQRYHRTLAGFTYGFEEVEKVFASLVPNLFCFEPSMRRHHRISIGSQHEAISSTMGRGDLELQRSLAWTIHTPSSGVLSRFHHKA